MRLTRIAVTAATSILLIFAVSCDLVSHQESSNTPTPIVNAPSQTVLPGQSWGTGNWFISLNGAEWHGCTLTVSIQIQYSGDTVAVFGKDDIYSFARQLFIRDKYNQTFYSSHGDYYYDDWYQLKYYPNEIRSGTIQFTVDSRSGSIWLDIEGKYTGSATADVFYLYDIPTSCGQ